MARTKKLGELIEWPRVRRSTLPPKCSECGKTLRMPKKRPCRILEFRNEFATGHKGTSWQGRWAESILPPE